MLEHQPHVLREAFLQLVECGPHPLAKGTLKLGKLDDRNHRVFGAQRGRTLDGHAVHGLVDGFGGAGLQILDHAQRVDFLGIDARGLEFAGCCKFRRVIDAGDAWFPNPASPDGLGPKIQRLRTLAGQDVPVTVLHVGPAEPDLVAGYAQLDVERIVFPVDTEDPDPLAVLDHLATLTA